MVRGLPGVLLLSVCLHAATTLTDLSRQIREASLDPDECYRVRDISFSKDDARLYLTDGYLIFGKPIGGVRTSAVFTTEVEGGDAELLVIAPSRGERQSLAAATGSPNLDEHFHAAVFLFGDNTYQQLMEQIRANPFPKKSPEMGMLMVEKWDAGVRNLASSFETRLVEDLLSSQREQSGFFAALLNGRKLHNFDLIYDPREAEQLMIGQTVTRDQRAVFDVWTSFETLPFRKHTRVPLETTLALKDFRIDATVESDLRLRAVTRVKVTPAVGSERALPFQISRRMRVTAALIDGQPAEVLQRESVRSGLLWGEGNERFLVLPALPLQAGREYEVELRHEGEVIFDAGNQVFSVGARGGWYPNHNMQFAHYDVTFRYPKDLDLVTAGEITSDKTDGAWRVTRRETTAPIRLAGFNLGHYLRENVARAGYTVEVCANQKVEKSLQPGPHRTGVARDVPIWSRRQSADVMGPLSPIVPNPAARLPELATEVSAALEFMSANFGPPPLRHLVVSPVPGTFGQGFAGLIYLSTLSYLRAQERPVVLNAGGHSFFTDLLQAHETAHQWWGNVVTSAGYRDDWIMESLANYSALLYLEKRSGRRSIDLMLDEYRNRLLSKTAASQTLESTGPIILGPRLETAQSPFAWQFITYGKGSWILHMLRSRIGDQRFIAMLGEIRRRYEWKAISTEQFRELAAEFLPPKSHDPKLESFFEQWVYGTGIPTLKLTYTVRGKAPNLKLTGTISQTEVEDDFSAEVPVEIQFANRRQVTWVETANEPVTFTVTVPEAPVRVALDPGFDILRK